MEPTIFQMVLVKQQLTKTYLNQIITKKGIIVQGITKHLVPIKGKTQLSARNINTSILNISLEWGFINTL